MPDRPDPVTDRLARFTPAAGLDRDALLFEAGRQSARPSRLWPLAAGLLAVSQAVTLVVLWPPESPAPAMSPTVPPAVGPVPDPTFPPASPDPDLWSVGSRPDVLERPVSAPAGEFVAGPPLTAGSALRFD